MAQRLDVQQERPSRANRQAWVQGQSWAFRHLPSPVQVREALEDLGVVYLKFGQVLALWRDLPLESYIAELDRLTDRLPPIE